MNDLIISREAAAHRGRRLEYFTIAWNSLEGLIGIGAGMIAGSVACRFRNRQRRSPMQAMPSYKPTYRY
jgi:hypothetical protein